MTLGKVYTLISAFRSLFEPLLLVREGLQMTRNARELAPLVGSEIASNRVYLAFHIGYNKRIIVVGNESRCIVLRVKTRFYTCVDFHIIHKILVNINTDK